MVVHLLSSEQIQKQSFFFVNKNAIQVIREPFKVFDFIGFYDLEFYWCQCIDCFPLFDINKFMSEEHQQRLAAASLAGEPPKRRRTPSQYASQIADFKNNLTITSKKNKSTRNIDNSPLPDVPLRPTRPEHLPCTLPSGKKLMLSIRIDPARRDRRPREEKKRVKRVESIATPKPKQDIPKEKDDDLLAKFLLAFQQLNEGEDEKEKEPEEAKEQRAQNKVEKKEERCIREKQKQQKWIRFYERSRELSDLFDKTARGLIFLP